MAEDMSVQTVNVRKMVGVLRVSDDVAQELVEATKLWRLAVYLDFCERHGIDPLIHSRRFIDAKIASECTGISADWCPVHGQCVCAFIRQCPLHAADSRHASFGG